MEPVLILLLLGFAVLLFYLKSPSVIGAQGEHRVSSTLRRNLDVNDYIILDDLTLPTARGTTQVDHVVLSRYGVFVVETKNMSGWIFGGETQARWTQIMRRHKSQFQNPLRQNYHHVKVIQNLLGIEMDQLENLVAFVGSAEPKTAMPPKVFWNRHDLFNYINARKIIRFTDEQVREFHSRLVRSALESSKQTRKAHIEHVRQKAAQREGNLGNDTRCPRCGSVMLARTNRKTGQSFFGCSRFPKCRGTRQTK